MDFTLGEVLYIGNETRVHGALEPDTKTELAVKLARDDNPRPRMAEKLRHEHALLSQAQGPGVIRVLGLFPYGQGQALVMERWPVSLDYFLAGGPLPLEVALRLGVAIARALGHVHRCRVLHRDIKPHNILVDAAQTDVRLIDFGIAARRALRVEAAAANQQLAGTLAYIAPEQTGRLNRAVDTQADLYSFGATLYHMLTGTVPFEIDDTLGILHAHIAKTPVPPHERAPGQHIPPLVSAIVLKLMEKSPDDRYQTGDGAAADLERALAEWRATGQIRPFTLGERDFPDRIRRPSRLFGRDAELAALEGALERVRGGGVVLSLVAGLSGVGKSALVGALREAIGARNAIFASGKYDQILRGTPYSALAQALRGVVLRRLADPPEELERWALSWKRAAGPNERILVDFVPELGRILGETKPLLDVGPVEARNRFQFTIKGFLQTLATSEHPLVLFLDDLQWADVASLALLQEIVTDEEMGHLWILGAYRSDEVGREHPLASFIQAAVAKNIETIAVDLAPLGQEALTHMVADMLERPAAEAEPLARIVKQKTDGSPFFVGQFLHSLHEHRLLVRDLRSGAWSWQREAIELAGITDNVAMIVTARLCEFSPELQALLQTAACIGNRFDSARLADVEGKPIEHVRAMLEDAVHEGLIIVEGDDAYAFVHDRVQQAAYEARSPEARSEAHLALGRRLRARYGAVCTDEELFATLHHRNRASSLLVDAEEKQDLARQNLRAGGIALSSTAYAEAQKLFRAAKGLLGESAWDEQAELTFEVHLSLAEATWLSGNLAEGEALFETCRTKATSDTQRAKTTVSWLRLLLVAGRYDDGLRLGLDTLNQFGMEFPGDISVLDAFLGKQLQRLLPRIGAFRIADLSTMPRCTDETLVLRAALLSQVLMLGAFTRPWLCLPIICTMVEQTFDLGLSSLSAYGMALLAINCISALQEPALGEKCAEIAFAIEDHDGVITGKAQHMACIASQYVLPLDCVHERWLRVAHLSECAGDINFSEYGQLLPPLVQLVRGKPLWSCTVPTKAWQDQLCRDVGPIYAALPDLLGRGASADAIEALANLARSPDRSDTARNMGAGPVAFAVLHLGEDFLALRLAAVAESTWMASWCNTSDLCMLEVLAALGHLAAQVDEEGDLGRRIAFQLARLEKYAAHNPTGFRRMKLIAGASAARAGGRHEEAERLYDEAIDDAIAQGFTSSEAIYLRLAGEYHLCRGSLRIASSYLRAAAAAYERWEAHACAQRIRERYPASFPAEGSGARLPANVEERPLLTRTSNTVTTEGSLNRHLDIASVLRAAQALAADRDLGSLIGRMLRLLCENAGAERAVLALVRDGELRIRAEQSLEPERMEVDLDEPAQASERWPGMLVQYVTRSLAPLVLGEASGDTRFEEDPYLRARRPASLLAVPLVHQGRLTGVVYLEHPRVAHAFSQARVEIVTLLSSQAATAVENAVLYTDLQASNVRLEKQVEVRTKELRAAKDAADRANRAKSEFLSGMSHELRTPLNGILGYAQILLASPDLSEKSRAGVAVIKKSGDHLLALINDVLDLAKIEAGKLELSPKELDLAGLLRTVTDLVRFRAEQKGLLFKMVTSGDPVGLVRVDERHLTQVLLNLLGNAVKFTQQGAVRLRVHTQRVDDGSPSCDVRFSVEDTGPGIAPEDLERIFEPFEQVGDRSARSEGTGLGLAICRRILEAMGGQSEVRSELGRGSTFTVTLRFPVVVEAKTSASVASWLDVAGYEGERRRILVVDDNLDNQGVIRDLLEPLGVVVSTCDSGPEALRQAEKIHPHLVFMDLSMPGMDGLEATRRLRAMVLPVRPVIIASSATLTEERQKLSAEAGCDGFLPKPVQAERVLEVLEKHLGVRWNRSELRPESNSLQGMAKPSPEVREPLHALVKVGRLREVVGMLDELAAKHPELGSWLAEARILASEFRLKELRDFLKAQ